jgi:hypothetical protein
VSVVGITGSAGLVGSAGRNGLRAARRRRPLSAATGVAVKYLAIVPLLAALAACYPHAHDRNALAAVRVDPRVLAHLDRIQEEFSREVVICLTGYAANGTVHVMGIQPVWISSYTATSAAYPSCPGRSAVGIYHNHPNGDCRFSLTDEREMDRLRHSVWLMSCGEGRFTWRLRASEGAVHIRRGSGS